MRRTTRLARAAAALAALAGALAVPGAARAADFTYVTMSDGIKIAVSISYPPAFSPSDVGAWPVLLQMDGYGGGGATISPGAYGNNYVTVYASIRGTGCSGGRFDLFDRRHALDGHEIIESFIVKQTWSNQKVGIIGHSYPGLTGWMVASTDPPHLSAVAISGLIDDLYRGIVYPGGVPNYGFPAVWTGAYRPAFETAGNAGRYASETLGGDPTCAANIAGRPARDVFDDPIVQGATSTTDETWWQVRSTVTWIKGITKPIHLTQQYQDEQTGPRGGHVLFQRIPAGVPKRLVVTNGVHSTTAVAGADRVRWLDCWIRGACVGDIADPAKRVRLHFETKGSSSFNAPYISSDWPLPETAWTRYYLDGAGTLTTAKPVAESTRSYVSSTIGRHMTADAGMGFGDNGLGRATFGSGPDELSYTLDFGAPTAIAGPIVLTLHASSTAPDTDFFVDLLDVDIATGAVSYLQRGMLRASHRAVDSLRSDYVTSGAEAGALYRPHRPHTNPTLVVPGAIERYDVEVFPLGHVFRAGHRLVVKVHAPPALDPLSIYAWVSGQPPALNTVFHGGLRASSLLLPVMPVLPPVWAAAPGCGDLVGVPCFVPALP